MTCLDASAGTSSTEAELSPEEACGPAYPSRAGALAQGCLLAALVVPPVIPRIFGPAVRLSALAVSVIGAWALGRLGGADRRTRPTAIGWLGAAVLAWTAVATALSPSPRLSLVGRYGLYGGLLPLALYAATAATVVALYRPRPSSLWQVAAAVVVAATISALDVVTLAARHIAEIDPSTGQAFGVPVGLQGHPNFSGAFLGLAVPSFVYLILRVRSRSWRAPLVGALALDLVALGLTRSRGGMLAAACGVAVMGWGLAPRLPRRVVAAGVAGSALAALALWSAWLQPTMRNAVDAPQGASVLRTKTAQIRLWAWQAAGRATLDHPLVGSGPDTFVLTYPRYRHPLDGAYLGSRLTAKPHNVVLERAADTGLPGAAAYVALLGLALWRGLRRARGLGGPERLVLSCFVGTLAAYGAQSLVSVDIPNLAVLGWVAIGAIAVLVVEADPGGGPPANSARRRVRRAPVATVAVAVAVLLCVAVLPAAADLAFRTGDIEEAIRLNPLEAWYPTAAAHTAQARVKWALGPKEAEPALRNALAGYQRALRLHPGEMFTTADIARLYGTWAAEVDPARFGDAERWWRAAIAIDPRNWDLRREHAAMLASWAAATGDEGIQRQAARERTAMAAILALRRR